MLSMFKGCMDRIYCQAKLILVGAVLLAILLIGAVSCVSSCSSGTYYVPRGTHHAIHITVPKHYHIKVRRGRH